MFSTSIIPPVKYFYLHASLSLKLCLSYLFTDLEVKLKNAIYKELLQLYHDYGEGVASVNTEASVFHRKEPLDFVRWVQEDWEAKVRRGINSLCTERGLILAREVSGLLVGKGSSASMPSWYTTIPIPPPTNTPHA